MNYVESFNLLGVPAQQITCVKLHGTPTTTTEGAVGVIGMDVDSPYHELYKCVSAENNTYTWERMVDAGYTFRGFVNDLYSMEDFEQNGVKTLHDVFVVDDGFFLTNIMFEQGDNIVRTGNIKEYTETIETSSDGKYLYILGNEYRVIHVSSKDEDLIVDLGYLLSFDRFKQAFIGTEDEIDSVKNDTGYTSIAEAILETSSHITSLEVQMINTSADKLNKNQGAENVGKYLIIDANGNIVPETTEQSEVLSATFTTIYPNPSSFVYTPTTQPNGYFVYEPSTLTGGRVSIDFDTAQLSKIEVIPYLLKDGVAYKYLQGDNIIVAGGKRILNENNSIDNYWINPNTGGGFCYITEPFSFDIPDGCTPMFCFRIITNGHTILPDSSTLSMSVSHADYVGKWAIEGGITITHIVDKIDTSEDTEEPVEKTVEDFYTPTWDTVIHRGWISETTENTLPAMYLAKKYGYDWVECDVRTTSDGIPVLAHDATITGTNSDGESITLTVAESTLEQLQALTLSVSDEFGDIKMGTLAELLDLARTIDLKVLIDIKISGETGLKSIAQAVLRAGMQNRVIYMPIGKINAEYIASVDKNASFDFVMFGTTPNADTSLSSYAELLTGSNTVNMDVQANTWEFDETVISSINSLGMGLCFWNVLSNNVTKCIEVGAIRLTKHNSYDATDLNATYFTNKKFW